MAVAMIVPSVAVAQYSSINTYSPYSFYGVGDPAVRGTAPMRAMGGAGLGFRSAESVNLLNPASIGVVERNSAVLHAGIDGSFVSLRTADDRYGFNSFNFSDVVLRIPLAAKVGFQFSLTPYSYVGYRASRTDEGSGVWENVGYVNYLYTGSGGVNRFAAGVGYSIADWLSIGAEVIYYQGDIVRNFRQTISPLTGSGYYVGVVSDNHEVISRASGCFGVQARLFASEKSSLTLGATYTMGVVLNSRVRESVMHAPYFSSLGYDDVINKEYRSDLRLPDIFSGGVWFSGRRISAGADYSYSAWGVNGTVGDGIAYRNAHSTGAGIEYTPNRGDVRRLLNRWSYRFGARFSQYYMTFGGQDVDELAVTVGVGIPLGVRARNTIDLGVELGRRGRIAAGLVREDYVKVSLGVSLFGDDYWFRRYKFD